MEFQSFLIKYSEIGIKGKNRYVFEDKLVSQIARKLKTVEGQFSVSKVSGRIYVPAEAPYDYDETIDALQHVFGIAGICPQVQLPDEGFEELKRQVVAYMDEMYPDKNITFKVIARRANKHYPIDSNEINARLGEAILDAFPEIRVDVHHPDVYLYVEVREMINIYSQIIPGPGGMPVGTGGRAMMNL